VQLLLLGGFEILYLPPSHLSSSHTLTLVVSTSALSAMLNLYTMQCYVGVIAERGCCRAVELGHVCMQGGAHAVLLASGLLSHQEPFGQSTHVNPPVEYLPGGHTATRVITHPETRKGTEPKKRVLSACRQCLLCSAGLKSICYCDLGLRLLLVIMLAKELLSTTSDGLAGWPWGAVWYLPPPPPPTISTTRFYLVSN